MVSNLSILLISLLPFCNCTAHTAADNLKEVKQQSTEDVVEFYACVISIIGEMELLPAAARHPAVTTMPPQIIALAGCDALPVAV